MQLYIGQRVIVDYEPGEVLSGVVSTLPGQTDRDGCAVRYSDVGVDLDESYRGIERHSWIFPHSKVRPAETELPTFKPGDRVEYIERRPVEMTGQLGTVRGEPTPYGYVPIAWDSGARYRETAEPSKYLRLVEPDPALVEPTDEQRAAVEWLVGAALGGYTGAEAAHAQALLAALPDALTNPQPALPTEPGLYVDARGEQGPLWRVAADKTIGQVGGYGKPEDAPKPFTRLVPERPPVTMGDLTRVFTEQTGARGVPITLARVLLKLANGTPDE